MNYKLLAIILFFVLIGGLSTVIYDPEIAISDPSPTIPCQALLTYRIGEIDQRYDISKEQVKEIMEKVESLWSTAMDKQVLDYQSDGRVAIELIYGEQQERVDQEKTFSQRINVKKQQREVLEKEYKRLKSRFEARRDNFQKSMAAYEKQVNQFNETLERWNQKGGVPQNKKREIQQMERHLKQEKNKIQREQHQLNSLRQRVNTKGEQLNALIKEEKELINTYNNRFAKAQKFNQGKFVKQGKKETVFIYQFSNQHDLKTVLAHEFGHAMGLEHVNNPKSVMYEIMEKQNIFNLSLTKEDIAALESRCSN